MVAEPISTKTGLTVRIGQCDEDEPEPDPKRDVNSPKRSQFPNKTNRDDRRPGTE